jgi:hypothetical protein
MNQIPVQNKEVLKINKTAEELRNMYSSSSSKESTNFIIYGGSGSGKTSLIRSMRTPILVHSFDPGGCAVLEGQVPWSPYDTCIDNGKILVDTRFEGEDPAEPTKFELWDKVYHQLRRDKFFDLLGTFVIDSLTTFSQCIMYYILKKEGRAGSAQITKEGKKIYSGIPHQNDWMPQMMYIENAIRDMLSFSCDLVLLAHDSAVKDEITGKVMKDINVTGKLTRRLPLLFSEMYHTETIESSAGIQYKLLTRKDGTYQAKTRMGKGGELELRENADIKVLLKKCNRNYQDKPNLF